MLGSWMLTVALLVAIGATATIGGLWLVNYRDAGNAPDATRRTSRRVVAVISGAIIAVAIALAELAGLLGTVGDLVSMFPGGFTQLVLAGLAIAGFQGWIEVGVVGFTLLVVGVLAGSTALTN